MRRFLRIRSRHPSHSGLRRNRSLLFQDRVVFRLGSTTQSEITKEINSIQAVRNSSDKSIMKRLFIENNVPTARHFTVEEMRREANPPFPVLAKLKHGSRGRGMKKLDNQQQLDDFLAGNTRGYYFEEYFNGSREYRLHVSALGCFYACRKLRRNEAEERWFFNSTNCTWITEFTQNRNPDGTFRSFTQTPHPSFNKPENWNEMVRACQNALSAVGLDIGAVDLRCKRDGSFVVLETNSAPSFGEITQVKYIEHLPQLVNHKY